MDNLNLEFYLPTELWILIFEKIKYNYENKFYENNFTCIPLHVKFVCKSWYAIFKQIPKFAKNKGDFCATIAFNGNLNLLKWAKLNEFNWNAKTCSKAARGGHLEIVQWVRLNGCPWNENTCSSAAFNGHLEILQWARFNGCPWDRYTCSFAALNGHFELLKWARENGCPWDKNTCSHAAFNGHKQILQWARLMNVRGMKIPKEQSSC